MMMQIDIPSRYIVNRRRSLGFHDVQRAALHLGLWSLRPTGAGGQEGQQADAKARAGPPHYGNCEVRGLRLPVHHDVDERRQRLGVWQW